MSLRTRIKGFTAWVNLRLKSQYDTLMSNVIFSFFLCFQLGEDVSADKDQGLHGVGEPAPEEPVRYADE